MRIVVSFLSTSGFIVNLSSIAFVMGNRSLRRNNIGSLVLFYLNTVECTFSLFLAVYHYMSRNDLRIYVQQLYFFFFLSQVMIGGLIIVQKIKLAAMNNVNHIVRNPSKETFASRSLVLIPITLIVCVILSVFLTHQISRFIILAILALIDIILYITLLIRLSKLKSAVGSAVANIRRKSLLYVTVLFFGFIVEIICAVSANAMQTDKHCPPILSPAFIFSWCVYSARYIWDPASYFLFNSQPRQLLRQKTHQNIQKWNCCNHRVESKNEVAVIHLRRHAVVRMSDLQQIWYDGGNAGGNIHYTRFIYKKVVYKKVALEWSKP